MINEDMVEAHEIYERDIIIERVRAAIADILHTHPSEDVALVMSSEDASAFEMFLYNYLEGNV